MGRISRTQKIFFFFSYDMGRDSSLSPPRRRADALRVEHFKWVYIKVYVELVNCLETAFLKVL